MSRHLHKYGARNSKILVILITIVAVVTKCSQPAQGFYRHSQTVRTHTDLAWKVRLSSVAEWRARGVQQRAQGHTGRKGGTKAWSRGKVPRSDSSG